MWGHGVTHTILFWATCIFPFSVSLSSCLSLWMRSWQLAAHVCHHSVNFSAWEGSVLGHAHTSECVITAGRRVRGWRCMEDSKLQAKKTQFNTVQTLSWTSLAQHVGDTLHCGLSSRRYLTSPESSWLPLVVTSQEAGGRLAQRLLLRTAATCFSHLLFTFSPSLFLSLL